MPSRITTWPAWPEFAAPKASDDDFGAAKRAIIAEYGAEKLTKSWIDVCEALQPVTDEIAALGNTIIPVVPASRLLSTGFTPDEAAQIRKTGCLVIRGVIATDEADALYRDLRRYIAENKADVRGWPADNPSILNLYNSPVQNAIRTNPRHLAVQRALNAMWHDDSAESTADPLIYLDGVRDRPPQQPFLGLGPHIDAGSLCRWADPTYRKAYSAIFAGHVPSYDAWDLTLRQHADQALFTGPAHSTVFRSFQGWTALTRAAPNEGTLLLYPQLKLTLAYMLLRPFFRPPGDAAHVMDPRKWSLDDGAWFPGTSKPDSQRLSRASHPHLRLEECLVHVPVMQPGDTVWWHSDVRIRIRPRRGASTDQQMCHAVDPEHQGASNAAVTYIAACPSTRINKAYVKDQLRATLAGRPPPDFAAVGELDETAFKGYVGHEGMSLEAKRALGYGL